jgi:hypothetical protein
MISQRKCSNIQHTTLIGADYYSFPATKRNLGGHKCKDDGEVGTVVTRWLITDEADFNRQRIANLV